MLRKIFNVVKKIRHTKLQALVLNKKSETPYQTHQKTIKLVLKNIEPEKVIEFGGGDFSTPIFLDKKINTKLVRLTTIENSFDWANRLERKFSSDDRFVLIRTERGAQKLAWTHITDEDLIFVDDSETAEERAKTLDGILSHVHNAIIILHDAEKKIYHKVYKKYPHKIYKDEMPWTVVICRDRKKLKFATTGR